MEITWSAPEIGGELRFLMVDFHVRTVIAPTRVWRLHNIDSEVTTGLRPADNIIEHDLGVSVAQARIIVVFYPDNLVGT